MPEFELPSPSLDRPTCCRMVAVFSTLWDEGARPRPGVVISDNGMHTRVKVLLDETDTEAIRHLLTTSGTADAVVPLHVFDALTQDQRNAIMAKTGPEHLIWAEWPPRPAYTGPRVGTRAGSDLTQSEVAANRVSVDSAGSDFSGLTPGDLEPAQPGKAPTGERAYFTPRWPNDLTQSEASTLRRDPEPAQPGKDPAGVELTAPVNNPDATPPGSPAGSHASTFTDP